jgi:ribonuclease P protein component
MSGASRPVRQGFTRQQRLLKASDYEAVYKRRRRVVDACFAVNFAPNPLGHARLGLSIGAKAVGNAVARNRVKRTVRESFRHIAAELGGLDVVVGARNGAKTAHNARLRESLDDLWKQIQKSCVVS